MVENLVIHSLSDIKSALQLYYESDLFLLKLAPKFYSCSMLLAADFLKGTHLSNQA